MTDVGDQARAHAERAERSEALDVGVRAGFVAYGAVHLVIAFLAIKLALGERSGEASSTGALKEMAQQPFGTALLWLIALGMGLLVVWRTLEVVLGRPDEKPGEPAWGKRAVSGGKAIIYALLCVAAVKVANGTDSGGNSEETMSARVMSWPGGQWLVVLAGLAVMAYGVVQIVQGWSEKHAKHLEAEGCTGQTGRAYLLLGTIGYSAKGVALLLVGGLFVWAGFTHDAERSGGMDEALATALRQPYGAVLVGLVGVGLGCYGLFCFARARHLSR